MTDFVVFGFDDRQERVEFLARLADLGLHGVPSLGGWTPPGGTFTPQWAVTVPRVRPDDWPALRDLGRAFKQAAAMRVTGNLAEGYTATFWDPATDVVGPWADYRPLAPDAVASGWTEHNGVRWTRAKG